MKAYLDVTPMLRMAKPQKNTEMPKETWEIWIKFKGSLILLDMSCTVYTVQGIYLYKHHEEIYK
mgnify:CR=1 FL=1